MSNLVCKSNSGYKAETQEITVTEVLQKLKEDLAEQYKLLASSKRAIHHLEIAIAAIEKDQAVTKKRVQQQRPTFKRGYLAKGVIEAIRDGVGTASAIVTHLGERGITTTQPSVSNAISRLQGKKQIQFDMKLQRWVVTANSGSPDQNLPDTDSARSDGSEPVMAGRAR